MKIPNWLRGTLPEPLSLAGARSELAEATMNLALTEGAKEVATFIKATKSSLSLSPNLFQIGDGEDSAFRRISSPQQRRDLNPVMQDRMQAIAYYLWATNPFAKRIIEVITSYVVGRGFTPSATDSAVQDLLNIFWSDPVNRMDRSVKSWCDEQSLYGEICVPVAVNPVDGRVRLGYIDPLDIQEIEFGRMETSGGYTDLSVAVAVILRRRVGERENVRLEIVHRDENPLSDTYGLLIGDCFYWAINKAKGASRGLGELFTLADWIDVFDQMIFDFADSVRFRNAYVWDVLVKDADETTLSKYRDELTKRPPKQGAVFTHNDKVEMKVAAPQLGGGDMRDSAQVVKAYGLGGAGLPTWFFADGTETNRSTADEMTGPTGKKFEDRQNYLADNVLEVMQFVVDQAIAHGGLKPTVDRKVTVQTPEIQVKDLQKAGTVMGAITSALDMAETKGWIKSETAARGFHVVLEQLGVQVDSKSEFEEAQKEKTVREANDVNNLFPQDNLANALDQAAKSGESVQ